MIFTTTVGRSTIITKLNPLSPGATIDPARINAERLIARHRANQLDAYKAPKRPMFDLHEDNDA